ncbi:MAG: hypothetical protein AVO35_02350 [Candidatus Aegiribacteria sp. MLS_C]|nr:MAG: hypothetical protein AVO35_02350 [Candidatus Aegiribacteria sp. MLS_C]
MKVKALPSCARCPVPVDRRACRIDGGAGPEGCPTMDRDLVEWVRQRYGEPALREFAKQASIQEGEGYCGRGEDVHSPRPCKPRVMEVAEFAVKMGYRRLGLVFCVGLQREAGKVASFLEGRGFEVVSVVCKAGMVPKEELGVPDDMKIRPGHPEAMCNPILQAEALNRAGTQFNIVMGLCVGHDSLFLGHSKAPCTVLVVKDRPTGHNPLAAINTLHSYYRYLEED